MDRSHLRRGLVRFPATALSIATVVFALTWSSSRSDVLAQDRFDLLQWAPQDLRAAIWTDDLSVTMAPLATSIESLLDRAERELRDRRSDNESDTDPVSPANRQLRAIEMVVRDLRSVQQGLAAPFFDGPAIAYRSAEGADVLIVRAEGTEAEVNDFLEAIERLIALRYFTPAAEDVSASNSPEVSNEGEQRVHRQLVEQWLVVTSSQESLDEVVARIEAQRPIDNLLDRREFRLIRANLPKGEPGSIRFHFDAETTRELMIGMLYRVDRNENFFPDEFKELFWDATALADVGGFGGQWTPSIDDDSGSTISVATLEAFAIQGAPFRGLAAALSGAKEVLDLIEAAPDAPPLLLWIQLQVDGEVFDRESRKLARQIAQPFAVASGKTVDELVEEFWSDGGLTWSPELSRAFDSIGIGFGPETSRVEVDGIVYPKTYQRVGLRFDPRDNVTDDLDRLCQGMLLQGVSDELAATLLDKSYLERIVDEGQVRWKCTDEYLKIYRDQYAVPYMDRQFSGENLERLTEHFRQEFERDNGRIPSQNEIDAHMAQRRQDGIAKMEGFPSTGIEDMEFRLDTGWFGLNEQGRPDTAATIDQGLAQRLALEQQIDELVERTSMQSKPAFVIAAWSPAELSLKELRDESGEKDSALRDLETALLLPQVIMNRDDNENPLGKFFGNSVIIGGLQPRGWELRAEFGRGGHQ